MRAAQSSAHLQAKFHGFYPRLIAGAVTVVGILYFATVISIVVDNVQKKMASLKKGLTNVVEKDHTVRGATL